MISISFKVNLKIVFLVLPALAIVLFGFLGVGPGHAHDPIFIERTQISPDEGPYLPDGNISFALYGSLQNPIDSRGFRAKLKAGDPLVLSLLIPNLNPEKLLPLEQLPTLKVERPDQSFIELNPEYKEVFDEPYTSTSYLRLLSIQEIAQSGVYHITINGRQQGRFTVSIGTTERFGTPVENVLNRSSHLNQIAEWYSNPNHQKTRPPMHDKSKGVKSGDNMPVILGAAALILISALAVTRIRSNT